MTASLYTFLMTYPYLASVSYVGTQYFGFQIQSTLPTIQGMIWQALRNLEPTIGLPAGASRTDAGVHALDQKIFFRTERVWDPVILRKAIQAYLPDDIQMNSVHTAADLVFRKSVIAKHYSYRLSFGLKRNPLENFCRWHIPGSFQFDINHINEALKCFWGTHDFSSFRASECVAPSPLKTLYRFEIVEDDSGYRVHFYGNQFLMHQVRILTGTLVEFIKNKLSAEDLRIILAHKDRTQAGPTAPPHGLTLEKIWLDPATGLSEPFEIN
ncbi:MAG: tRNA pseudouridine synthase A [Holophagaceae bacterium]